MRIANTFNTYCFQKTGITQGLKWLTNPAAYSGKILIRLRQIYVLSADYILAAMNITGVFAVRLAILTLAMPAFALLSLVGLIDLLVQHDVRRWSGVRESSFIYHWPKKFVLSTLILTWMIYLALPISVHPNIIELPFVVIFAVSLTVIAATFNKYL